MSGPAEFPIGHSHVLLEFRGQLMLWYQPFIDMAHFNESSDYMYNKNSILYLATAPEVYGVIQ